MAIVKRKWKSFLIVNYINTALWLLILAMAIVNLSDLKKHNVDLEWEMLLFLGLAACSCFFGLLNIFILRKYLPTRKIKGGLKVAYISGVVFWFGIFVLFLIAFIYLFDQEFISKVRSEGIKGKLMLFVIALFATITLLVPIWQIKLINFLGRNYELELNNIIESIGSEQSDHE